MDERAKLPSETEPLYMPSEAVAREGDTKALRLGASSSNHPGALWKIPDCQSGDLEGSRKGPLNRGCLEKSEDAFRERTLEH